MSTKAKNNSSNTNSVNNSKNAKSKTSPSKASVSCKALTDCPLFLRNSCYKGSKCKYRHCSSVLPEATEVCPKWVLSKCFDATCNLRHPRNSQLPVPTSQVNQPLLAPSGSEAALAAPKAICKFYTATIGKKRQVPSVIPTAPVVKQQPLRVEAFTPPVVTTTAPTAPQPLGQQQQQQPADSALMQTLIAQQQQLQQIVLAQKAQIDQLNALVIQSLGMKQKSEFDQQISQMESRQYPVLQPPQISPQHTSFVTPTTPSLPSSLAPIPTQLPQLQQQLVPLPWMVTGQQQQQQQQQQQPLVSAPLFIPPRAVTPSGQPILSPPNVTAAPISSGISNMFVNSNNASEPVFFSRRKALMNGAELVATGGVCESCSLIAEKAWNSWVLNERCSPDGQWILAVTSPSATPTSSSSSLTYSLVWTRHSGGGGGGRVITTAPFCGYGCCEYSRQFLNARQPKYATLVTSTSVPSSQCNNYNSGCPSSTTIPLPIALPLPAQLCQ